MQVIMETGTAFPDGGGWTFPHPGRADGCYPRECGPGGGLSDVVLMYTERARRENKTLLYGPEGVIIVYADRNRLRQVFINIWITPSSTPTAGDTVAVTLTTISGSARYLSGGYRHRHRAGGAAEGEGPFLQRKNPPAAVPA